jgi:hypothetical protein
MVFVRLDCAVVVAGCNASRVLASVLQHNHTLVQLNKTGEINAIEKS